MWRRQALNRRRRQQRALGLGFLFYTILIGTKFDLFDRLPSTSRERQVFSQENLDKYAADFGFVGGAHQVSSLSKYNVERTLLKLLNVTVEFMEKNKNNAEKESLNLSQPSKKTSACCKT